MRRVQPQRMSWHFEKWTIKRLWKRLLWRWQWSDARVFGRSERELTVVSYRMEYRDWRHQKLRLVARAATEATQ